MKQSKIRYILLLMVVACGFLPLLAATPNIRDYDALGTTVLGGYVSVSQPSEGVFVLTAVPVNGSFKRWTDGSTTNPRTVNIADYVSDVTQDVVEFPFKAEFSYVVEYCKSCGDYDIDTTGSHVKYGYIEATKLDGSCWQLTAVPNEEYGIVHYDFLQWSDGYAYNPRTIDLDSIRYDEITYTALFSTRLNPTMPREDIAKIDQWELKGSSGKIKVKAKYESSLSGTNKSGQETYYATVFFDGKPAGSYLVQNEVAGKEYGVYKLTYDASEYNATTLAGKKCHIVFKNSGCDPFGVVVDATIPYLVTGSENVTALDMADRENYGVHVLPDANATFTGDPQNIAELDIYAGGKATIATTVNATSVIMRSSWPDEAIPQLLVTSDGHLNNTNGDTVYYDAALDYKAFYPFALPSDVAINTNQVRYRTGESACDRFALDAYSGVLRAQGDRGWVPYYYYNGYDDEYGDDDIAPTGDVSMTPGTGYTVYAEPLTWKGVEQSKYRANIRFPMKVNLRSAAQGTKSISVYHTVGKASEPYKNWNLIALPYVSAYQGTITAVKSDASEEELAYIYYSSINFNDEYTPEPASTYTLQPFNAYFVQVPDNTDSLRFEAGSTKLGAPRRAIKAVDADRIKAGLTLSQADKSDHAGLLIGEKYTNDYDINGDLAKMFGSDQGLALFMLSGSQELAYIALPPAEGNGVSETVIPLGYNKATMGQEMTFAFDEERYPSLRFDERIQALELIDYVEGSTTNLLQEPYTCTAYEKADNTRFALGIRYTKTGANVTTGICDDVAASKVNDGIYDLMGRRVNADDVRSLGAGVYIIMENGKARKEVIR